MQNSLPRPVPFMSCFPSTDLHLPVRPGMPIPVFTMETSTLVYNPFSVTIIYTPGLSDRGDDL